MTENNEEKELEISSRDTKIRSLPFSGIVNDFVEQITHLKNNLWDPNQMSEGDLSFLADEETRQSEENATSMEFMNTPKQNKNVENENPEVQNVTKFSRWYTEKQSKLLLEIEHILEAMDEEDKKMSNLSDNMEEDVFFDSLVSMTSSDIFSVPDTINLNSELKNFKTVAADENAANKIKSMQIATTRPYSNANQTKNFNSTCGKQSYNGDVDKKQRCSVLIEELQHKLKEQQEQLSVAIKVDDAKNFAIIRLYECWGKLKTELQNANEEKKQLQRKIVELSSQIGNTAGNPNELTESLQRKLEQSMILLKENELKFKVLVEENNALKSCLYETKYKLNDEIKKNMELRLGLLKKDTDYKQLKVDYKKLHRSKNSDKQSSLDSEETKNSSLHKHKKPDNLFTRTEIDKPAETKEEWTYKHRNRIKLQIEQEIANFLKRKQEITSKIENINKISPRVSTTTAEQMKCKHVFVDCIPPEVHGDEIKNKLEEETEKNKQLREILARKENEYKQLREELKKLKNDDKPAIMEKTNTPKITPRTKNEKQVVTTTETKSLSTKLEALAKGVIEKSRKMAETAAANRVKQQKEKNILEEKYNKDMWSKNVKISQLEQQVYECKKHHQYDKKPTPILTPEMIFFLECPGDQTEQTNSITERRPKTTKNQTDVTTPTGNNPKQTEYPKTRVFRNRRPWK